MTIAFSLISEVGLVSMTHDLSLGKADDSDTDSIADSALGTSSVVTGTTFTGVSQFSEVRQ